MRGSVWCDNLYGLWGHGSHYCLRARGVLDGKIDAARRAARCACETECCELSGAHDAARMCQGLKFARVGGVCMDVSQV